MSNPTSNFGWQMPTATDLVTDLPADFEVFGQAVDTALADLKGGTSGQVLSKNSNTDMDFVWSSPNPGDITAVTAGTGISGGGTSGDVTITNSMATEITAKGDLIVGTGSATFDNLAAGTNGSTLVADSSTSTGLRYTAGTVQANPFLNSAMQVWQRGTSFVPSTASVYTADRWQGYRGVAGSTVSRQVTGDTTNLPNIQYCARIQRDSGNTSTATIYFGQSFESVNSIPFAGKTVTFSFYARKGANYSTTASDVSFLLQGGALTDANVITAGGWSTITTLTATLTTTWQRFSITATVPTTVTQLGTYGVFNPTGTAGAADFCEVTGFQLDIGSVALPFRTNAGTIQGELAACQRYYNRITPSTGAYEVLGSGYAISTTVTTITVPFPVPMRIKPTAAETTGTAANYAVLNGAGGVVACSVVPAIDSQNTNLTGLLSATVASGLTAGQGTQLRANNTTAAYIGWSAEL